MLRFGGIYSGGGGESRGRAALPKHRHRHRGRELKDAKVMTIVCKKFLKTKLVVVESILSERNRPTFLVSDKIHG